MVDFRPTRGPSNEEVGAYLEKSQGVSAASESAIIALHGNQC